MAPSAVRSRLAVKAPMIVALLVGLVMIWVAAYLELERSRQAEIRNAEKSGILQAQAFAENTNANIKRLDEALMDLRMYWVEDQDRFPNLVRRRIKSMADIAFQVAVIDADGYLAYSSLEQVPERIFLGEREHFLVHRKSGADHLFISNPVLGMVSGQWSIQFTRPILVNNRFNGVLVVSVTPDSLTTFYERLEFGTGTVIGIVKNDGEILVRHPDKDRAMGKAVTGTPYQAATMPLSGTFTRAAQVDGVRRIYGYYRLPEYKINLVVGYPEADILAAYYGHRNSVLASALAVSVLVALLLLTLYRSVSGRAVISKKLLNSRAILRSAIDTMGEAFVIYDENDRLAYCNEQYRECFPLSADLLVPGASFEEIVRIGAQRGQYKEAEGRVEAWVGERIAAHRAGNTELIEQLDDGRWLRIVERKTPEGFTAGFRIDITELYKAKLAAEAASVAKSRFLATMSHEIRTPLNGILGMAQLLLMQNSEDDERRSFARAILNSGQTLLGLLNDILDLSKIEAGKFELAAAEFDPVALIEETEALFSAAASRKQLRLEVAWTGPRYRCLGDPNRLRQMLSNLVGNAIKFTETGVVRIEGREIASEDGSALLEFSVLDTGIGVSEAQQASLFTPFSQADNSMSRKFGGTGLGLSIVSNLARLMGGNVGVDSQAGHGSRFWFTIRTTRLAAEAESGLTTPSPIEPPAETALPGSFSGRILVAEDDRNNQTVIKAWLSRLGLDVDLAENGLDAVAAIARGAPASLILMDIQMPVMDGLTATRRIREWEATNGRPRHPIIAVTAHVFEDDRQACLAAGMDDLLTKPLTTDDLKGALARWLPAATVARRDDAEPVVATTELDPSRIACQINELMPLLAEHKFDALARFKELQASLAGSGAAVELAETSHLLNEFHFDQVQERLRRLAAARGWEAS